MSGGEIEAAPFHEFDGIDEGGVALRGDAAAPGEFLAFGSFGDAIEDFDFCAQFTGVTEGEGDFLEDAEGEASGRGSFGGGGFQEAEGNGIGEAGEAEEAAGGNPCGEEFGEDRGEETEDGPADEAGEE